MSNTLKFEQTATTENGEIKYLVEVSHKDQLLQVIPFDSQKESDQFIQMAILGLPKFIEENKK